MWHAVIGFLVVHPSHAQAPVPGLTVVAIGKQFVNQQLVLCTKGTLLTTILLRCHEVSLSQMSCNPLCDN